MVLNMVSGSSSQRPAGLCIVAITVYAILRGSVLPPKAFRSRNNKGRKILATRRTPIV